MRPLALINGAWTRGSKGKWSSRMLSSFFVFRLVILFLPPRSLHLIASEEKKSGWEKKRKKKRKVGSFASFYKLEPFPFSSYFSTLFVIEQRVRNRVKNRGSFGKKLYSSCSEGIANVKSLNLLQAEYNSFFPLQLFHRNSLYLIQHFQLICFTNSEPLHRRCIRNVLPPPVIATERERESIYLSVHAWIDRNKFACELWRYDPYTACSLLITSHKEATCGFYPRRLTCLGYCRVWSKAVPLEWVVCRSLRSNEAVCRAH